VTTPELGLPDIEVNALCETLTNTLLDVCIASKRKQDAPVYWGPTALNTHARWTNLVTNGDNDR
jgi:hypothetical protein